MKKNVLFLFLMFAAGSLFAQAPLAKGQAQLNGGVGFRPMEFPYMWVLIIRCIPISA